MSRVAPPQAGNALPAMADDVVGQALDIDSLSLPAGQPAQDFASALLALRQAPPADAAQPQLAPSQGAQPAAPALAAAVADEAKPSDGKQDQDEGGVAQVDVAALSPAMQPPLVWPQLQPAPLPAVAADAQPQPSEPAPRAIAAAAPSLLDAKALAALTADAAAPRADAQQTALLAALPLPAPHAADNAKPADTFSLQLPASQPDSWSGKLQAALGERLQVLSSQNQDRATLRLDPPALGTLEIAIRHQAGALTVELTASHSEVVKQLQTIGDSLRQDLGNRQYTQVAVEVKEGAPSGYGQGGRQNREQQPQQNPGRALREQGWQTAEAFELDQG
ncbi:flagellar hook-length control protein FliK [Chromobacterium subtsugae]|uniref:flagellar hook-length control protein FliK n=1 Tax=Chromobacterium subtsugae TaxID=251747 RepID=UPI0007F92E8C|nr:flagellar hook-length control protein FliK [Chromobacterium subtsugae]